MKKLLLASFILINCNPLHAAQAQPFIPKPLVIEHFPLHAALHADMWPQAPDLFYTTVNSVKINKDWLIAHDLTGDTPCHIALKRLSFFLAIKALPLFIADYCRFIADLLIAHPQAHCTPNNAPTGLCYTPAEYYERYLKLNPQAQRKECAPIHEYFKELPSSTCPPMLTDKIMVPHRQLCVPTPQSPEAIEQSNTIEYEMPSAAAPSTTTPQQSDSTSSPAATDEESLAMSLERVSLTATAAPAPAAPTRQKCRRRKTVVQPSAPTIKADTSSANTTTSQLPTPQSTISQPTQAERQAAAEAKRREKNLAIKLAIETAKADLTSFVETKDVEQVKSWLNCEENRTILKAKDLLFIQEQLFLALQSQTDGGYNIAKFLIKAHPECLKNKAAKNLFAFISTQHAAGDKPMLNFLEWLYKEAIEIEVASAIKWFGYADTKPAENSVQSRHQLSVVDDFSVDIAKLLNPDIQVPRTYIHITPDQLNKSVNSKPEGRTIPAHVMKSIFFNDQLEQYLIKTAPKTIETMRSQIPTPESTLSRFLCCALETPVAIAPVKSFKYLLSFISDAYLETISKQLLNQAAKTNNAPLFLALLEYLQDRSCATLRGILPTCLTDHPQKVFIIKLFTIHPHLFTDEERSIYHIETATHDAYNA